MKKKNLRRIIFFVRSLHNYDKCIRDEMQKNIYI